MGDMAQNTRHQVIGETNMQKQKAFDLILRLAIESPNKGASGNAVRILDNLKEYLTQEQIQISLERYPVKEV